MCYLGDSQTEGDYYTLIVYQQMPWEDFISIHCGVKDRKKHGTHLKVGKGQVGLLANFTKILSNS